MRGHFLGVEELKLHELFSLQLDLFGQFEEFRVIEGIILFVGFLRRLQRGQFQFFDLFVEMGDL